MASEYKNSDMMAEKNGLFTIRATGKSAKIVNAEDFEPKHAELCLPGLKSLRGVLYLLPID